MARATKEQSEVTAAQIRTTARRLFADLGYADVSLERVAELAGVTRGAVYHHFGSKLGLFTAVVDDAQAVVAAAVAEAAPDDGWTAIEAGSLAFMRAVVDPSVRRVLLVDGPAVLGWTAWRSMDEAHSGRLLVDGLGALDDLAVDPAAAAALLNGAMNEAALWIAAGGDAALAEHGVLRMIRSLRS
ncbi:TetR family transcriptional regulator [Cellulomonas xylanilytica]|uniref:HTH tetR-type domain-containing protein n=1 Tax=Cellulomonas xylanilytica TaxID=233583 RepID=A0A510V648_9CELL|nr:TetR family transcriptional regulator [Cellulomonas xylanilytica]GEK22339.1 hypothetical protein CXY01_28590 [Cellulomonas xylanilytica]